MLRLGEQTISTVYFGGVEIKKAYLGEDIVLGVSAPPVPTYSIVTGIDAGSGTISGSGTYREGETATITAVPLDGYEFAGWRENGIVVSTDETYSFTVVEDRTLIAVFEAKSVPRLPGGYTELEYIESIPKIV